MDELAGLKRTDRGAAWRLRLRWLSEFAALFALHLPKYGRLMRLHRPIGIWLLLWPTLWALWLATDGQPSELVFVVFVLGTVIMRSAGCIINDFADRNIDSRVARTADRPLATGEVDVAEALVLFLGLLLIAFGLVMTLNTLTVQLALAAVLVTVLYPFAKRFISVPQLVLGVAFSWGVPMAFAAEQAEIPRLGWLLFLSALIWVVIYDTEYAMADRDEDLKIGVRSSAILFGEMDRAIIGGLQLLFLMGLALVGRTAELGAWYFVGLALAAALFAYQQYLIKDRVAERCFVAFGNNAWVGGAVFSGILLDYVFRGVAGSS